MKNRGKKISIILLAFCMAIIVGASSYAHSGRTDGSGGHKDNKNKSGLGSYHYHCGGNPPHLHTGGVCPYSSKTTTKKTNTTIKSNNIKSSTTSTKNEVKTIAVESIKMNVQTKELEIGENNNFSVTVLPDNATNKEIKWSSSNEGVATVDTNGKITAKKEGKAIIKVQSQNGKTDQVEILIKKKQEELAKEVNTIPAVSNSINADKDNDNSNPVGVIVALGILGGGAFLGYKKYKK